MKSKPKFDKKKCLKCKYRGLDYSLGYPVTIRENGKVKTVCVYCNYNLSTEISTLTTGPNKTVIDIRGTDYDNCQLFVEGEPEKKVHNIHI